MKSERFHLTPATLPADNNIRYQYPIHRGTWIRHPEVRPTEPSFCRYSLDFVLQKSATIEIHVSADNRFELFCDSDYVGMGPDRSDIEHWNFHSYRLYLNAGEHSIDADVHFLGLSAEIRPWAQTCIEPAFVLYSDDQRVDLNTGSAPWQVTLLEGVATEMAPVQDFFVVGPNYTIDGTKFTSAPRPTTPQVVRPAGHHSESGGILSGWKLYPSSLPEQTRVPISGGRIRCIADIADDAAFPEENELDDESRSQWQAFVDAKTSLTVPARKRVTVLWDLQQYYTAYPEITTSGGRGSSIKIEWAEACFEYNHEVTISADRRAKGNRNEISNKYFRGYGDTFLPPNTTRTFRPFWWRAGRYVRITIQTGGAPLTLEHIRLLETRMPLESTSTFTSSDAALAPIVAIAERGIFACAHETYMDCPYYEQLMYVGDTRLQMLTSYVMSPEDRLNQRSIELFDWSRMETGFVLERYPSQPSQLSCTFSMIWILMLRDYAWWRKDATFVRQRLKGLRCLLEEFKSLTQSRSPLLPALPGWSFVDWVGTLSKVNHPSAEASTSGIVNLLFLNALGAAADLEASFGEAHLAEYNRVWAERLAGAIQREFWHEQAALFADDAAGNQFSEHAQCLALLSGRFPSCEERCFESLITTNSLVRTTVYFSFYLLECFAKFGRGDLILDKLEFWKTMISNGLKTPVEMPEPTRSDCHAWGSHPLFHLHASLAGIRPDAPNFGQVRIAPSPGGLESLASSIPHPNGTITLSMMRNEDTWQTEVTLPVGVTGMLYWQGETYPIHDFAALTLTAEQQAQDNR